MAPLPAPRPPLVVFPTAFRWGLPGCYVFAAICAFIPSGDDLVLEAVKWLRAIGCPWEDTCFQAVQYGYVKTLRWARENGAPWNDATRDLAAEELGYTDGLGNLLVG